MRYVVPSVGEMELYQLRDIEPGVFALPLMVFQSNCNWLCCWAMVIVLSTEMMSKVIIGFFILQRFGATVQSIHFFYWRTGGDKERVGWRMGEGGCSNVSFSASRGVSLQTLAASE